MVSPARLDAPSSLFIVTPDTSLPFLGPRPSAHFSRYPPWQEKAPRGQREYFLVSARTTVGRFHSISRKWRRPCSRDVSAYLVETQPPEWRWNISVRQMLAVRRLIICSSFCIVAGFCYFLCEARARSMTTIHHRGMSSSLPQSVKNDTAWPTTTSGAFRQPINGPLSHICIHVLVRKSDLGEGCVEGADQTKRAKTFLRRSLPARHLFTF